MNTPADKPDLPEPVAVVGSVYTLYWAGSGPIAPLIEGHGIKVGDGLYAASQVQALLADERRKTLEAASKAALNGPITADMMDSDSAKAVSFHISARIRALIDKEPT